MMKPMHVPKVYTERVPAISLRNQRIAERHEAKAPIATEAVAPTTPISSVRDGARVSV